MFTKGMGAGALAAVCVLSAQVSTQSLQMTNADGLQPFVFNGHVLSGPDVAAGNAAIAAAMTATTSLSGRPEALNTGGYGVVEFTGHVLTPLSGADGPLDRILYAPSEADDAGWRGALAAATGGATVDYFDASAATPSVALMQTYDAVYTWANFAYSNNVLMGNNLAAFNDLGGTVVMGSFCTYTSGNFLSGLIMTPAYSPVVSPLGNNHFSSAFYAGDGTTCIYNGVTAALECFYRDFLVAQGTGVVDGTYLDSEVCHAYRQVNPPGAGDVVYSNGAGAVPISGGGEWDWAVGNSSLCGPGVAAGPKALYAPSDPDDAVYRAQISAVYGGAQVDYFDARAGTPTAALLAQYNWVYTWANFAYANNVLMGDRLADYVDTGGNVVLGVFCTFTTGNFLSGRIMTPAYSPVVSPLGTNHYAVDFYAGDGLTCIYNNVVSLDCNFRDFLVTQGGGVVDGTYLDGEICHAFQSTQPVPGAGTIVYSNGVGNPLGGGGDWDYAATNSGTCLTYGSQVARNSALPPFNAKAWLIDPGGPPSVTGGFWVPSFDPGLPAWAPPLGPGAFFFVGYFLQPAVPDLFLGGPQPWLLGNPVPPNPIVLQGPLPAPPGPPLPVPIPIPPNPALIGVSLTSQAVAVDLFVWPWRFTNAIDVTVGM